jgi:hypothetical protein
MALLPHSQYKCGPPTPLIKSEPVPLHVDSSDNDSLSLDHENRSPHAPSFSVLDAYNMSLDEFKDHLLILNNPLASQNPQPLNPPTADADNWRTLDTDDNSDLPPLPQHSNSNDRATRFIYISLAQACNMRSLGPRWGLADYKVVRAIARALERGRIPLSRFLWSEAISEAQIQVIKAQAQALSSIVPNGDADEFTTRVWTPERAFTTLVMSVVLKRERARALAIDDDEIADILNDENYLRGVVCLYDEENPCLPPSNADDDGDGDI